MRWGGSRLKREGDGGEREKECSAAIVFFPGELQCMATIYCSNV